MQDNEVLKIWHEADDLNKNIALDVLRGSQVMVTYKVKEGGDNPLFSCTSMNCHDALNMTLTELAAMQSIFGKGYLVATQDALSSLLAAV